MYVSYGGLLYFFQNTDKMNEVQTQTKRKYCRTNYVNIIHRYFYSFLSLMFCIF